MSIGAVLIGFLEVLLTCAIIVLIAYAILWAARVTIGGLDANVEKWGRIVVGLLCLIVIASWLLSLLGIIAPFRPIRIGEAITAISASAA